MIARITLAIAVLPLGLLASAAPADPEAATRQARWSQLQEAIFPGRQVLDGEGVLVLEAPARALDAALVPLTVSLTGKERVRDLYLVIDNNPGPLAGRFTFGPAADPRTL